MNVRNCRNCGKIFNYTIGPILCPTCKEELEEKFQKVKAYIRDNKGVGVQQVSEECDVSVNQIHQWLRDERLELVDGSAITLQCENCGAPITSGRICEKCKRNMISGFQDAMGKNKVTQVDPTLKKGADNPRMRFLERD